MKKIAAPVLAVLCIFAAIGNPFGTQTAFVASAAAKQNPALAEAQANVKAAIEAMTITSHTTAEDILKKLSDGSSLADAAKAAVEGAEIKEQTDLIGSSVETDISEWLKSADRKAGDTTVIDGSTGSYVVVFTKRDNNQAPTEESGDQNYCDYVAENLLKQDVLSEWNEHVFSGIVEVYKGSFTGASRYVGI